MRSHCPSAPAGHVEEIAPKVEQRDAVPHHPRHTRQSGSCRNRSPPATKCSRRRCAAARRQTRQSPARLRSGLRAAVQQACDCCMRCVIPIKCVRRTHARPSGARRPRERAIAVPTACTSGGIGGDRRSLSTGRSSVATTARHRTEQPARDHLQDNRDVYASRMQSTVRERLSRHALAAELTAGRRSISF